MNSIFVYLISLFIIGLIVVSVYTDNAMEKCMEIHSYNKCANVIMR